MTLSGRLATRGYVSNLTGGLRLATRGYQEVLVAPPLTNVTFVVMVGSALADARPLTTLLNDARRVEVPDA